MADNSIALQVQTPNLLGAMGNLVNTAQGIQAFQSGQIQQQRLGLNLQSEAQANQERRNVVQAMQAGDPDLQADPASGLVDIARATSKLQQLAPQTYNNYLQNIQTSNSNNNKLNDQLIGLDKDARDSLSGIAAAGVGQPVSVTQDTIRKEWLANNPGAQAQRIGNQLLGALDKTQGDQGQVDAVLKTAALRTKSVPDIIAARQAGTTLVNQGPQSSPVVTQPNWSGQQRGTVAGSPVPMGASPSYQVDASGNLVPVPGFMPGNKTTTAAPSQGALPAPPAWMNKQQAQNASDAQARWSFAQSRDVDTNAGYQPTAQVYKNLKTLLDQNPNLGPGSAGANQFIGRISTLTKQAIPDLNTAYQETASYLDRLGAQNALATGAANKFQDEQAARATGSPEAMGPPAIQEKLRFGSSINEASHAYAKASQAFLTKQGPNAAYANPQLFEGAWSENADPIAFRLMAARNNGDTADYKATIARATPETLRHYQNLQTLMSGRLPTQ